MKKIGFDIDEYRRDAQKRHDRAQDVELQREANSIAADQARTSRRALYISLVSLVVSIMAIVVTLLAVRE